MLLLTMLKEATASPIEFFLPIALSYAWLGVAFIYYN